MCPQRLAGPSDSGGAAQHPAPVGKRRSWPWGGGASYRRPCVCAALICAAVVVAAELPLPAAAQASAAPVLDGVAAGAPPFYRRGAHVYVCRTEVPFFAVAIARPSHARSEALRPSVLPPHSGPRGAAPTGADRGCATDMGMRVARRADAVPSLRDLHFAEAVRHAGLPRLGPGAPPQDWPVLAGDFLGALLPEDFSRQGVLSQLPVAALFAASSLFSALTAARPLPDRQVLLAPLCQWVPRASSPAGS